MLSQEDKNERLVAAGALAVVVSPCLIACLYYFVLGQHQTALLYAVPAVCCGLLYLPSVGCDLPLPAVYERVEFAPGPEMPGLTFWTEAQ